MMIELLLAVFVLVIIIILVSETTQAAMIVIVILANTIALANNMSSALSSLKGKLESVVTQNQSRSKLADDYRRNEQPRNEQPRSCNRNELVRAGLDGNPPYDHGIFHYNHLGYTADPRGSLRASSIVGPGSDIDSAVARYSAGRNLNERALTGQAAKDINYYRYHYGDELDRAESRVWWGNYEH